jgi:hypothetical protein
MKFVAHDNSKAVHEQASNSGSPDYKVTFIENSGIQMCDSVCHFCHKHCHMQYKYQPLFNNICNARLRRFLSTCHFASYTQFCKMHMNRKLGANVQKHAFYKIRPNC